MLITWTLLKQGFDGVGVVVVAVLDVVVVAICFVDVFLFISLGGGLFRD